jgi:hypothetical protein
LSKDNKRAPHELDDEFDDGESHAADEPTAVWDESALRAAGLTDLLKKRGSEPPPPPATPAREVQSDPSIVIEQDLAAPAVAPDEPAEAAPAAAPAAVPASGGLGWGATVAIAVAVGAIVYLLIRLVKG